MAKFTSPITSETHTVRIVAWETNLLVGGTVFYAIQAFPVNMDGKGTDSEFAYYVDDDDECEVQFENFADAQKVYNKIYDEWHVGGYVSDFFSPYSLAQMIEQGYISKERGHRSIRYYGNLVVMCKAIKQYFPNADLMIVRDACQKVLDNFFDNI